MMRNPFAIALVVTLAACGGAQSEASSDGMAQAPDTTIRQIEREPLTDADFVELDRTQMTVEIPWTRNTVNRSKAPAAPRSLLEALEVSSSEGFDRAMFTFGADAPFPGYTVELVDAGTAVVCGVAEPEDASTGDDEEGQEGDDADGVVVPELEGERMLVVRIEPGWNADRGRTHVRLGTEQYGFARVTGAGLLCSQDDMLTFVAGLSEGSDVRVMEMRDPHRLVVDVR